MSYIRRLKRKHVDPVTGSKSRKGNNESRLQLIILENNLNNLCKVHRTRTIAHMK